MTVAQTDRRVIKLQLNYFYFLPVRFTVTLAGEPRCGQAAQWTVPEVDTGTPERIPAATTREIGADPEEADKSSATTRGQVPENVLKQ